MRTAALLLLFTGAVTAEPPRPYVYPVIDFEVIDGDSIRTKLDLGFDLRTEQVARLEPVDAPEIDTAAGRAVARFSDAWCKRQKSLTVVSLKRDKYAGRYLAELHGDHAELGSELLRLKLARPYQGGKRKPWTDSELSGIERAASAALQSLDKKATDGIADAFTMPDRAAEKPQRVQVWVTDTGEKYHVEGCRFCDASGRAVDLQAALAAGMEPCKVCRPRRE